MRTLICLILLVNLIGGHINAQDSTWIKIDLADFEKANAMETYEEAADFLAGRVAKRRKEGLMTATLVENYHKVALWYMQSNNLGLALSYVETTLELRNTTDGATLTDIARSEYLKGEILLLLNNYYLSNRWTNQSLETLRACLKI